VLDVDWYVMGWPMDTIIIQQKPEVENSFDMCWIGFEESIK